MSFVGLSRVPFAFYRSGTSRGLFLLEKDLPSGPARDAVLCKLMGSGHPQQIGGFGGGSGPTSKVAVVGAHEKPGWVTYSFAQCEVDVAKVDKSHGDCGNMLAAVAPFALERGLASGKEVKIESLVTGACYEAELCVQDGHVVYQGDLEVPGTGGPAAPVRLKALNVSGSQCGELLPTGRSVDLLNDVRVTLLDFARALVIVDAMDVLPNYGYRDLSQVVDGSPRYLELCEHLEMLRRRGSELMKMGDCAGKDAPKLALVAISSSSHLACRYFVNPGRAEMHPTIAMTAAQALGAACLLKDSVAMQIAGRPLKDSDDFTFTIEHAKGSFPVSIATSGTNELFPDGIPYAGCYETTVMPIAEGIAFLP